MDYEKKALDYHQFPISGKLSVESTKPLLSQEDLSLAYTPGVAGPCREIAKNQDESFKYTVRGNLVGVISNGTAVLGLGNIGPYAGKPVMEGKGMLFKKFANIDVFDIEVDQSNPDEFIKTVSALEPTFGGINLEDIKAPECFYIEEKLREKMAIPVFHDDQHGTAIIVAAALLNACEITKRSFKNAKIVFSGAGAAAVGCARILKALGAKNIIMCDSTGVIHENRAGLNEYKKRYAIKDSGIHTLEEALDGADVFIGVSVANILSPEMLKKMEKNPIVFALSNPNPEIDPNLAKQTRPDVIMATGRSDYPNQVNNLLGFPYIFRGALDVRAKGVNDEMMIAAVHAIADLAKESVPEEVLSQYDVTGHCVFGKEYLIPKPVDQRVLLRVAPAVAKAAMDTGMARVSIDLEDYKDQIARLLGPTRRLIRRLRKDIVSHGKKQKTLPRIVLPYGFDPKILKAAKQVADEGEVKIVLLGKEQEISKVAHRIGIDHLENIEIINPYEDSRRDKYADVLYELRKRKGISRTFSHEIVSDQNYFGAMMLHQGDVDGMVNGVKDNYRNSVKPILEVIGARGDKALAGVYMMVKDQKISFFADCTINIDPTAEQLADIAMTTAEVAKIYTQDPIRVAMLSYTSFGISDHPFAKKVAKATQIVKELKPDLEIDGEMQADVALNKKLREKEFPFTDLKGDANVLVFPSLSSANISYKLLQQMGQVDVTGPILVGLNKPANVMQREASVKEIVNMIYVSAHQAISK